jgi:hypothetical protein
VPENCALPGHMEPSPALARKLPLVRGASNGAVAHGRKWCQGARYQGGATTPGALCRWRGGGLSARAFLPGTLQRLHGFSGQGRRKCSSPGKCACGSPTSRFTGSQVPAPSRRSTPEMALDGSRGGPRKPNRLDGRPTRVVVA